MKCDTCKREGTVYQIDYTMQVFKEKESGLVGHSYIRLCPECFKKAFLAKEIHRTLP